MERRWLLQHLAMGGVGMTVLAGAAPALAAAPRSKSGAAVGRALIQSFVDALNAHDVSRFNEIFADDYIQHQAVAPAAGIPPGAPTKQLVMRYFAARVAAFPDLKVTVEAVVASRTMAAANFIYTGTQKGEYFGVPATGKRITFNSTDIYRIRDGRLAEHWGAADIAGLMQQLKS